MKNVRIWFEKKGAARYISHLDLTRNMARGLKLSGLPVWYTEGYNPRIYMTYAMPLSLGVCGERECMDIRLTEDVPLEDIAPRLNAHLPAGLQALEATELWSVCGLTDSAHPLVTRRPFRAPHHTISARALAGGGSFPRPGEISLAHHGVLFLDELPEFQKSTLEVLRQPLEDGQVQISRVSGTMTFPSRFMLVCAMNPCKCGWYGHPGGRCQCGIKQVQRYRSRISGPLLDRIDMKVEVAALDLEELTRRKPGEPSAAIRERVNKARAIQNQRYAASGLVCNAQMGQEELRTYCVLDEAGTALMRQAYDKMELTARSYDRILRLARTIADLAGAADIAPNHLAEALQYRTTGYLDE